MQFENHFTQMLASIFVLPLSTELCFWHQLLFD